MYYYNKPMLNWGECLEINFDSSYSFYPCHAVPPSLENGLGSSFCSTSNEPGADFDNAASNNAHTNGSSQIMIK